MKPCRCGAVGPCWCDGAWSTAAAELAAPSGSAETVRSLAIGAATEITARGARLAVKRVRRYVYCAWRVDLATGHSRWGKLAEILADVAHFEAAGNLPRSRGKSWS